MPRGMKCEDCELELPVSNPFWKKRCNSCYSTHRKKLQNRKCVKCNEEFIGETWKKLCMNCFRSGKKEEEEVVLVRTKKSEFGFF